MTSNAFKITPAIKDKLVKIDSLYQSIILTTLSPKLESQLRFDAMLNHLQGWSDLANQGLTKQQLFDLLGKYQAKNITPLMSKVLDYKNALNHVRAKWTGNTQAVTFASIAELSVVLGVNVVEKETVEPLLSYLYSSQLHPVVQASLAHLAFYPSRSAYLLSLIYLAKSGYDLRGFLSLEDCWSANKDSYLKAMQQANETDHLEAWSEYFCDGMIAQMTTLQTRLEKLLADPNKQPDNKLSERQQLILALVEQTDQLVTNRQVQENFKVSQITASRDLARLSLLGLIGTQGAGRSTAYFKI